MGDTGLEFQPVDSRRMSTEQLSLGANSSIRFAPVILAGGSGTRFWPRSRRTRAKQVLALDGVRTMIQQTLERLLPVADAEDVWVITNELLAGMICAQLPEVRIEHILREPAARNTAPACALAAFLLEKTEPDTVIGIFPSDHVVKDSARFAEVLRAGVALAAVGETIVVLGVSPTRAETGYGYIELGTGVAGGTVSARQVRRFTEKPEKAKAEEFLAAGNYCWNSGIFLWSVRTLTGAIREHCPAMAPLLERIAAAYGTPKFEAVFAEVYPQCESISVDYAVLERRSRRSKDGKGEGESGIVCLPGDFGWNDLGSWAALHEHHMSRPEFSHDPCSNVVEAANDVVIGSRGNYVFAPGMAVALVGVEDLVVVQTEDALLITTREKCQDVGKVVKELAETGRGGLI
jgi:mannose-1-phosphate guanylyltransferase